MRAWHGHNPKIYVAANNISDAEKSEIESRGGKVVSGIVEDILSCLFSDGVQTLLVEGGAQLLQSFIDSGLWDSAYVETGDAIIKGNVSAPHLNHATLTERQYYMGRIIEKYIP